MSLYRHVCGNLVLCGDYGKAQARQNKSGHVGLLGSPLSTRCVSSYPGKKNPINIGSQPLFSTSKTRLEGSRCWEFKVTV